MHRRSLLSALGTSLLPLAGCSSDGEEGTPSSTPTATPPTGTPRSTPPSTSVAVETPAPGACEAASPPTPTANPLASPRAYPTHPADLTPGTVRSFLRAYESAFVENLLLARTADAPEGASPVDPDVDADIRQSRHGDGWFLAGVASAGGLGYDFPDSTPLPANVTASRTPTRTPVSGVSVSRAASYLLTDRLLLRQDRGRAGDAPAAVDGGTVYACF